MIYDAYCMDNKIGRACGIMGKRKNKCEVLVRKPGGRDGKATDGRIVIK